MLPNKSTEHFAKARKRINAADGYQESDLAKIEQRDQRGVVHLIELAGTCPHQLRYVVGCGFDRALELTSHGHVWVVP
jgi:hypothetical protein